MTRRERFEAWCAVNCSPRGAESPFYWSIWQARDPEVARLVEALREAKHLIADGYGKQLYGDPYIAGAKGRIDALLREYDGEKRDE